MKFFLAHNGVDIYTYNVLLAGQSTNYNLPYLEYFDSEEELITRLNELGQTFIPRTFYLSYNDSSAFKYGLLDESVAIHDYQYLEYFATEVEMIDRLNKIINNKQSIGWNDSRTPALHKEYPYLTNKNYKTLQLDNLVGIRREAPISDRGLKGIKKYYKGDVLIWSSEKKYWFEDENVDGFVRIIKLYSVNEEILDSWEVFSDLSIDDKQLFIKKRRELIFEYFKSKSPDLFSLLYTFFSKEINDYVMIGGNTLANTLIDAKDNSPHEIVRQTLSMEVPRESGGVVTVLDGVLYELI